MSQQMGEVRTAQGWGESTEDGGWRRGPLSGGGWTFPGVGTSGKTGSEIGTWQNPSGSELWPGGSGTNVIVDSTDKEAWPSIGDNETASDPGDDGASVKSGSALSGSSGQGGQGNEAPPSTLPPTSWAPGGGGFGLDGNTWGNPPTSANLSMGWSSASLPASSQGHCLQSSSMAPSDTLSNSVMSNMSNSAGISSHGWGGMPSRGASAGSNQPQNSMSMQSSESLHGALPGSTGAQQTGPPVSTAHSGTGVNPLWQGGGGSNGGGAGYSGGGMPQYKAPDVKWTGKEGEGADRWGTSGPDPGSFGGSWGEGAGSKPGGPGWDEGGQGGGAGGDNSWARGASKGGDPNGKPAQSAQEKMRMDEIRAAIESNEGWGSRPVKQDTAWDIEDTPTDRRKYLDPVGASAGMGVNPPHSNVWNNNNGTAIWEPLRENPGGGSGGGGPPHNWAGGSGGGGGGGMRWDDDKDPSQWGGARPSRPPDSWGANGGGGGGGGGSLDKPIGTWGGGGDNQSKAWGGKTEVGSWGEPPGASGNNGPRSISTWGEPEQQPMPWEENPANRRPGEVDDGTAYWGRSNPSWSSQPSAPAAPITPRNKPDDNWARGPPNKPASGWGEPGAPGAKVDDGTSIWAANAQQQARAAGWGDTGGQWNPAVGARPKSTLGWGGDSDSQWNSSGRKPSGTDERARSEGMGEWKVGVWNDASSWCSAPGWKSGGVKQNPGRFPGMNNTHHPQMRSKLLQQLMDMGFKKEEAQHALISNNMNVESAIAFLMNSGAKKDGDMDVFPANGKSKLMAEMGGPMVNDDLADTHSESNPHVPNFPMQNTPFPNAQLPNQPFIPNPVNAQDRSKGPSLSQSSLAAGSSSINPSLQQRLLQHRQQQQQQMHPPSIGGGGLGAPRGQIPPSQNVVQQQLAQQQILQQLRMAVQSGLISPQLLNQQLPHNILVMLQQLLQLQNVLQQLVTKQQQLLGNKMSLSPMQRQQLEGMPMMIQNIKTQIVSVQKQLAQAQQLLLKTQPPPQPGSAGPQQPLPQQPLPQQQQPPQPVPPNSSTGGQGAGDDMISPLQSEMGSLSMQTSAQAQSRLTKWSRSVADKEGEEGLNKAVGSRPLHQSQSNPNLGSSRFELPSFMSSDSTWSNTAASSNWPSVGNEVGENKESDDKDGPTPTTTSSSLVSCDIIPEFVPGKPWQGLTKSVEDDPHMTPGMIHRSLSVNVVDPSALKSSPTPGEGMSAWSTKDFPKSMQVSAQPAGSKAWSPATASDMWSSKQGQQVVRPPPSAGLPSSSLAKSSWNRQNSWAGRTDTASAFTPVNQSNWESRPSSWLLLRNINAQVDGGTLRALCQQHGPLSSFSLDPAHQQAAVRYSSREEAVKAQKALHGCVLSGASISAELLAEGDAARLMETQPTSQWQPTMGNSFHGGGHFGGSRLGELGSGWGSAPGAGPTPAYSSAGGVWSSSLWGGPQSEDHAPTPLLGNILSGEPA